MTKMMLAIALSIAVPAVASAQTAPAAPKKDCCEKMKQPCECCKDMDGEHAKHGAGADAHAGHDDPASTSGADAHH